MTPTVQSKQPNTPTTIFTIMSALALEQNALNLSQGFPSFDCATALQNLVTKYMAKGKNQYPPMPGILELRQAISNKYEDWFGVKYDAQAEITITTGATEALYATLAMLVHPGDEVIVLEPCYDLYVPTIELHGGIAVYYKLNPENGYSIDWQQVRQLFTAKTRAIMVNTPHNPTGSIFSENDLNKLAEILKDTNIFVISDEVYEHIVMDGAEHWSVMRHPGLKERSIICGSFGKTYHTTGWKSGYCLAPAAITAEFRKVHQWVTFTVNSPMQYAYAEFLQDKAQYQNLSKFYEKKKKIFLDSIAGSNFEILPAKGSFFQSLCYKDICDTYDFDLAIALTKTIKVASIPMSIFFHDKTDHKILRFCFAKDDDMLVEAGKRLKDWSLGQHS